ncbi:MAG: tRNA (adenosine(37)-N6)-threonylcarbamoyltransferase complex transferase subunit TsaD [Verrucomicrobiae bacterium]|nr:tRNA (adenosine(37)-N6)-threonylcarbamoyltransferase complex transferase subunit TsaD [Verrucomicrobiae bacterium]
MTVLAIETSCDETGVAIIRAGRVLSNLIASQIGTHAEYGGVVPELATREHLRNLPVLARLALESAGIDQGSLELIAATRGPGLPGALLVGFKAAQGLAYALRLPFIGIHHHEAHLYSAWIRGNTGCAEFDQFRPNVSLIVSGGHTLLVHVRDILNHVVIGETLDDAAGECFDKTARLIGLPYPGGPQLERMAKGGNPFAYPFPRPMIDHESNDFSFSGLKTAVAYFLRDHPEVLEDPNKRRDLCASVQAAIVDVLVFKTLRAAKRVGADTVTVSGGVACNLALREALAAACQQAGMMLRVAEPAFCTDNAAMIGLLAELKMCRGTSPTDLDADIEAGWPLG